MADVTNDTIRTTYTPVSLTAGSLIYFEAGTSPYVATMEEIRAWLDGQAYSGIELTRYTETTAAATASVDRADGGIQTLALTADITLSVTIADGESLLLIITGGDSWSITWPTMTWIGGSVPTLAAETHVELLQVGATLYGYHAGDA